jgi:uncharacterized protein (DUF433 family)
VNINKKREIKMNDRIISDPNLCGGEPCIRGTRIAVHIILSHLAAGDDFNTVLQNFPRITMKDIQACLEYAAYPATEKEMAFI